MSISSCCDCFPCYQKSEVSHSAPNQTKHENSKTSSVFKTTLHSPHSGSALLAAPPTSPIKDALFQTPKVVVKQNFFSYIDDHKIQQAKPQSRKDQVELIKQPSQSFSRTSNSQHSAKNSQSSIFSTYKTPPPISPLHLSKLQLKKESLIRSFSHLSLSSSISTTSENIHLLFFKTFQKLCEQGFSQTLAALITEYTVTNWNDHFKKHSVKLKKTELLEILQHAPLLNKYLISVECDTTEISDRDLTYFNQLSHLNSLFLTSCRHLTPVCLSYLQKLENLSDLTLEDCSHFLENSQAKGTQLTFEAEQNISILQRSNPRLSSISITEMSNKKTPYTKEEAIHLTLSINKHF